MSRIPTEWEDHPEYSVEWFRVLYHFHDEWLGTQGKKLWEHYAQLEAENERLQTAYRNTADVVEARVNDYKRLLAENERLRIIENNLRLALGATVDILKPLGIHVANALLEKEQKR